LLILTDHSTESSNDKEGLCFSFYYDQYFTYPNFAQNLTDCKLSKHFCYPLLI